MQDYKVEELSEAKYSMEGYELRQVVKSGQWAMFRSYGAYGDDGVRVYYSVDDDWGQGNIDDESLFSYRVMKQQDELAYLMSQV